MGFIGGPMIRTLGFVLTTLLLATSSAGGADTDLPKSGIQTLSNSTPSTYQRTLSAFSGSTTSLTPQQKAQVKAAVDANPTAEKFICTGIRYYSQPTSINIMVRKRAKAACDYAKELNPNLSTWFQNKPTNARSYAGKVLLTVKTNSALTSRSGYKSVCDFTELDKGWEQLYEWSTKTGMCVGPTGWHDVISDAEFPLNWATSEQLKPISQCKLMDTSPAGRQAFDSRTAAGDFTGIFPRPDSKLLVFGIQAPDTKAAKSSPSTDYLLLGNLIRDWVNGMNDFGDDFRVSYSSEYLMLDKSLGSFNLFHNSPKAGRQAFYDYILPKIKLKYSLSDFDGVLLVTTPGTSREIVNQADLGFGVPMMFAPPATYTTSFVPDFSMIQPNWIIHEWGHTGAGLDDPDGSGYYQNGRGALAEATLGMAGWGMQSTSLTDRLGWIKWITGMLQDQQVTCASNERAGIYALKASNMISQGKKLVVIPLARDEVLVLESIRATGLNYKLSFKNEGVLVYRINNKNLGAQELFADLVLAPNKSKPSKEVPLIVPDAPLKKGESVTYGGIRIEITDSVDQGDLITIRPDS
jgi:hypothetical protein